MLIDHKVSLIHFSPTFSLAPREDCLMSSEEVEIVEPQQDLERIEEDRRAAVSMLDEVVLESMQELETRTFATSQERDRAIAAFVESVHDARHVLSPESAGIAKMQTVGRGLIGMLEATVKRINGQSEIRLAEGCQLLGNCAVIMLNKAPLLLIEHGTRNLFEIAQKWLHAVREARGRDAISALVGGCVPATARYFKAFGLMKNNRILDAVREYHQAVLSQAQEETEHLQGKLLPFDGQLRDCVRRICDSMQDLIVKYELPQAAMMSAKPCWQCLIPGAQICCEQCNYASFCSTECQVKSMDTASITNHSAICASLKYN